MTARANIRRRRRREYTVTASGTYGYSLRYIRPLPMVAAWGTYGHCLRTYCRGRWYIRPQAFSLAAAPVGRGECGEGAGVARRGLEDSRVAL